MNKISLSIVMPCYNEAKVIEKIVRTFYAEVISKIDNSEFIVVNDASSDNTNKILERLKKEFSRLRVLKNEVNLGHGKALHLGYEAATNEWIFQIDSDGQFEAKDFWRLYSLKDSHDFILGFRKVRRDRLVRKILTKIICIVNFLFFGVWINDANCPFRLIKKVVLAKLIKDIDKDVLAPNIMISLLAKKRGIRMAEVSVAHYKREKGVSWLRGIGLISFSLKGFRQLIELKNKI